MSLVAVDAATGEVLSSAEGPLALLEHSSLLLAQAETFDEVRGIRDRAEAIRTLARKAHLSLEVANRASELKLRAERRAGEMLAALPLEARSHDATHLSDLDVNKSQSSRWQRVATIPEPDFNAYIAEAFLDGKELTTSGALKLAKRLTAADKPPSRLHAVHDPDAEAPPVEFSAVVIDPPWRYDNVATRGAAEDHYPTMSQADLAALELPAADDSHLYLWVTNGFLREGFDLIDAWGFTYKTVLTWCKPQIGMGNWFRNATEHVLFGVKGKLPTQRNDVSTWFVADRTRHSAKPESFYDLVESCSPGPYLEMFARRRRLGWHTWGNEA